MTTEVANVSTTQTTSYQLINSLPIGNYQISVRAIAQDRSPGAWSDAMTYNSTLGPVLATVHPLASGVKSQWTAARIPVDPVQRDGHESYEDYFHVGGTRVWHISCRGIGRRRLSLVGDVNEPCIVELAGRVHRQAYDPVYE
ncbi:MAG: hypothetical protein U0936_21145 [Planctomycetaceae bacterium]